MAYSEQVFDSFFVVESLRPDELQTGTLLHARYLRPRGPRAGVFIVDPVRVNSRVELKGALRSILKMVAERNLSPILQLETHGNTYGLGLASGEHVAWDELGLLLQPINQASENTLFIGSSMCCGGWMFRAITRMGFFGRAPLWGFIGPTEEVPAGKLLKGFGGLYKQLLYDQNTGAAFTDFAKTIGDASVVLAETVLGRWWQHMLRLRDEGSSTGIYRLAECLGVCLSGPSHTEPVKDDVVRDVFARHRARYLYLDLFPQHGYRFGITFDMLGTTDFGFGDAVQAPGTEGP